MGVAQLNLTNHLGWMDVGQGAITSDLIALLKVPIPAPRRLLRIFLLNT